MEGLSHLALILIYYSLSINLCLRITTYWRKNNNIHTGGKAIAFMAKIKLNKPKN